jgi:hypothetical protein
MIIMFCDLFFQGIEKSGPMIFSIGIVHNGIV